MSAARSEDGRPGRKPAWLKLPAPLPARYRATGALLDDLDLHTVCTEARCPNKGECYASGTATFLILGDVCTRSCCFCAVTSAAGPVAARAVDPGEPARVAEAVRRLGLQHVVVTSVTRDDLPDGGAAHFAATIAAVRAAAPSATVEVLIPDLGGDEAALRAVLAARPDVLGHNLEMVPRLYSLLRPQALYERSLALLARVAVGDPRPLVKTGLMVGLGESAVEVAAVLADAAAAGVDAVTIGQYLQPRAECVEVDRYVTPAELCGYARSAAVLGLEVVAGPFVRSSYRAHELMRGR